MAFSLNSEPPGRHVLRVDALRGVAILLVVISHAIPRIGVFPHFELSGIAGVSLFFVISGFCIHLTAQKTLRRKPDCWGFGQDFLWRRFWRIYPPYVLALLAFTYLEGKAGLVARGDFWAHLFLIHNWSSRTFFTICPAFWSIAVECQFYLLYLPFLAVWRRFGTARTMWGLALLTVALRGGAVAIQDWNAPPAPALWCSPLLLFFDWSLGVWVAERWLAGAAAKELERLAPWALGLVLPAALTPVTATLCFPLFSLFFAGLLSLLLRLSTPLSRPERWLVPIGLVSYSLYLWHQPLLGRLLFYVQAAGLPRNPAGTLAELLCLVLPALLLGSWVAFQCIERPSLAIGHSFPCCWRPITK